MDAGKASVSGERGGGKGHAVDFSLDAMHASLKLKLTQA